MYPIMLNQLIFHKNVGFPGAVRASAFLTLTLLVIANILMFIGISPKVYPKPAASHNVSVAKLFTDLAYMVAIAG